MLMIIQSVYEQDLDAVIYFMVIVYFIVGFCCLVQLSSFLIRQALKAIRRHSRRKRRR